METQEKIIIKPNGDVILHLPAGKEYKRYRCIGTIRDGVFYTYRSSSKNQLYHYSNSFNFNYRLLNDSCDLFDVVCVNFEGQDYWTSRERILSEGKFVNYKNKFLDRQIGISFHAFKSSRAEAVREMNEIRDKRLAKIEYEKQYRAEKQKPKEQLEFAL